MADALQGTDEAWSMFQRSRDAESCDVLELPLCVICDPRVVGVRPELADTDFFMPDRAGARYEGTAHDGDPAVRRFDFASIASRNRTTGRLRFFGPFCHGPAGDEFVYLGWKPAGKPDAPWVWRLKLSLTALTWEQLEEVVAHHERLEHDATGRTPGKGSRTEWRFVPAD